MTSASPITWPFTCTKRRISLGRGITSFPCPFAGRKLKRRAATCLHVRACLAGQEADGETGGHPPPLCEGCRPPLRGGRGPPDLAEVLRTSAPRTSAASRRPAQQDAEDGVRGRRPRTQSEDAVRGRRQASEAPSGASHDTCPPHHVASAHVSSSARWEARSSPSASPGGRCLCCLCSRGCLSLSPEPHPQRPSHRAPPMTRALALSGFGELRRVPEPPRPPLSLSLISI